MPSIDNITTTGGLTFDIEPIDLWTVERDWSNFFYAFSYRVVYNSNTGSYFIPTSTGIMYTSKNGFTWTRVENGTRNYGVPPARNQVNSFASNGQRMVVNLTNPIQTLYSNDGFNWEVCVTDSGPITGGMTFAAPAESISGTVWIDSSSNGYVPTNATGTWSSDNLFS